MSRAHGSKFDSRLTELVYSLSLDGGPDEEAGSSSEAPGTWAGLMRGGRQMAQALQADSAHGLDRGGAEDDDVIADLNALAGVILFENSDGRVESELFADGDELEERWDAVRYELRVDDDEEEYVGNARRHVRAPTSSTVEPDEATLAMLRIVDEELENLGLDPDTVGLDTVKRGVEVTGKPIRIAKAQKLVSALRARGIKAVSMNEGGDDPGWAWVYFHTGYNANAGAGERLVAVSYGRYRGGAKFKRLYGGSTVTQFYVFRPQDENNAANWATVEGYGAYPGNRRTDALEKGRAELVKRGIITS